MTPRGTARDPAAHPFRRPAWARESRVRHPYRKRLPVVAAAPPRFGRLPLSESPATGATASTVREAGVTRASESSIHGYYETRIILLTGGL
jgi:hypothetical protein